MGLVPLVKPCADALDQCSQRLKLKSADAVPTPTVMIAPAAIADTPIARRTSDSIFALGLPSKLERQQSNEWDDCQSIGSAHPSNAYPQMRGTRQFQYRRCSCPQSDKKAATRWMDCRPDPTEMPQIETPMETHRWELKLDGRPRAQERP